MEELSFGEQVIALARRIATEKLAPRAAELDRERTFPWRNVRTLAEAGFFGVPIAEAEGGLGLGRVGFVAVVRELAKACASTALVYVTHPGVAKALEIAGGEAVKRKWLPEMLSGQSLGAFAVHEAASGCNETAIITRAKRDADTYILKGSKFFVTSGGEAHIYLVLARTDPEKGSQGMSMLLVEKDAPGLSFGRPEDKIGLTSTSSRELFFADCSVPASNLLGREGEGLQVQGRAIAGWGLFGAAAISAGIAAAATELAIKHARERVIAGQPIAATRRSR